MALIQAGNGVTNISGKSGGNVYSRVPSGIVMKSFSVPGRRVRSTQPRNRARLGLIARWWQSMTDLQREAWEAWAQGHPGVNRFGEPFIMSGINAFTKLNITAMRMGTEDTAGSPNTAAPVADLAFAIDTLTASDGGADGTVTLVWTLLGGAGSADDSVEIQVTPGNVSRAVQDPTYFRYYTHTAGNILTADVEDLTMDLWYWFRVRYVSEDGQTSAWIYAQWEAPDVDPA